VAAAAATGRRRSLTSALPHLTAPACRQSAVKVKQQPGKVPRMHIGDETGASQFQGGGFAPTCAPAAMRCAMHARCAAAHPAVLCWVRAAAAESSYRLTPTVRCWLFLPQTALSAVCQRWKVCQGECTAAASTAAGAAFPTVWQARAMLLVAHIASSMQPERSPPGGPAPCQLCSPEPRPAACTARGRCLRRQGPSLELRRPHAPCATAAQHPRPHCSVEPVAAGGDCEDAARCLPGVLRGWGQ
jgi:hypothetical protein